MKIIRFLIALILIALPIAGRYLWFYSGTFQRETAIPTPAYENLQFPIPPVSTPDIQPVTSLSAHKIILIDQYHGNYFSPAEIEPFLSQLSQRGAKIEFLNDTNYTMLTDALKYASAYMVIAPLVNFSPTEISAVNNFVDRGGKLLVITDPTRNGSYNDWFGLYISSADVTAANLLLAPYQLAFQNDYLYDLVENEGNFRNIYFDQFSENDLVTGLQRITLYAAHSITSQSGTGIPLFTASDTTLSSLTDQKGMYTAGMLSANGQVLALGDFTFMTNPYNQVTSNHQLMQQIASFLLHGQRTHDLTDFPYLFNKPVSVLFKGEIGKEPPSGMFSSLGYVQTSLQYLNIPVSIAQKEDEEKDLIVLGLFEDASSLNPYLQRFQVKPTDIYNPNLLNFFDAPIIKLPGIGSVQAQGTGVILYQSTPEKNLLLLLAQDSDSLQVLISKLTSYTISGCLIQQDIAVCDLNSFY